LIGLHGNLASLKTGAMKIEENSATRVIAVEEEEDLKEDKDKIL
jgi:hypothetical protein